MGSPKAYARANKNINTISNNSSSNNNYGASSSDRGIGGGGGGSGMFCFGTGSGFDYSGGFGHGPGSGTGPGSGPWQPWPQHGGSGGGFWNNSLPGSAAALPAFPDSSASALALGPPHAPISLPFRSLGTGAAAGPSSMTTSCWPYDYPYQQQASNEPGLDSGGFRPGAGDGTGLGLGLAHPATTTGFDRRGSHHRQRKSEKHEPASRKRQRAESREAMKASSPEYEAVELALPSLEPHLRALRKRQKTLSRPGRDGEGNKQQPPPQTEISSAFALPSETPLPIRRLIQQVTGFRNTSGRDVTVTLDDVLSVRRHIHEIVLAKAGDQADVAAGGGVLLDRNHRDIAQLIRLWDGFLKRIIAQIDNSREPFSRDTDSSCDATSIKLGQLSRLVRSLMFHVDAFVEVNPHNRAFAPGFRRSNVLTKRDGLQGPLEIGKESMTKEPTRNFRPRHFSISSGSSTSYTSSSGPSEDSDDGSNDEEDDDDDDDDDDVVDDDQDMQDYDDQDLQDDYGGEERHSPQQGQEREEERRHPAQDEADREHEQPEQARGQHLDREPTLTGVPMDMVSFLARFAKNIQGDQAGGHGEGAGPKIALPESLISRCFHAIAEEVRSYGEGEGQNAAATAHMSPDALRALLPQWDAIMAEVIRRNPERGPMLRHFQWLAEEQQEGSE